MDSGWAVVVGASIALIGSAIVPWVREALTRRGERRVQQNEARLAALRRIIPELIGTGAVMRGTPDKGKLDNALRVIAEFEVWLTADEWPLARMATQSLIVPSKDSEAGLKAFRALVSILPAWMRGDISPARAKELFETSTGTTLVRDFDEEITIPSRSRRVRR